MRYQPALMSALALPATADAHPGSHHSMGLIERTAHMLTQHFALGVAAALCAALLIFLRFRTTRGIGGPEHIVIDREGYRK